ncbi:MAG TPA: o-succinylbenzoate synthase [Gemmatimonadales bacterium]|nr:o-succinylbenzoate synthase [Gemmatimonadales bacterium]
MIADVVSQPMGIKTEPVCVRRIVLREIRLPLREPFRISSGVVSHRRILLLELTDSEGVTTWSECVAGEAPNYSPETVETAWVALTQWIGPRVLGRPLEPNRVLAVLEQDVRGHRMAKAAVEMGIWALAATRAGTSLARFIGGVKDKIPIGISLGIQSRPADLVDRARAALAQGYHKIKLKIKPGSDVAFVRAVREALGEQAPLMADANNAYTLSDAEQLAALDAFGLLMIEQPLAWDDLVRHAELQKRMTTPICLDESITSVERAEDMITLGSGRIVNIKPGRVGGLSESRAIHDLCARHGIPVWCGGMLESGVGRAYNVALASLPNFVIPGDVSPSARYWERDIVTPEWTMDSEGMMRVPVNRPGIGVDVDLGRVEGLTVRQEILATERHG